MFYCGECDRVLQDEHECDILCAGGCGDHVNLDNNDGYECHCPMAWGDPDEHPHYGLLWCSEACLDAAHASQKEVVK